MEAYFSNVIFDLDEIEKNHRILAQSRVDKSTAENMESAMKLVYKDGIAEKMHWIEEGDYIESNEIRFKSKPIQYRNYALNDYKSILQNSSGLHSLGGNPSPEFVYPKNRGKSPFVYLGHLDCEQEKSLNWMGISKFNMFCPIFEEFEIIFIAYEKPLSPKIILKKDFKNSTANFEGILPSNNIEFERVNITLNNLKIEQIYNEEILGNTGSPTWFQENLIPVCPLSGKDMKFVVMLESNEVVNIHFSNVELKDLSMQQYLERFNFWGDGALFVFFQPETQVAAYFIQNT